MMRKDFGKARVELTEQICAFFSPIPRLMKLNMDAMGNLVTKQKNMRDSRLSFICFVYFNAANNVTYLR